MPAAKWGFCGQTAAARCPAIAGQDCLSGTELTLQGGKGLQGLFLIGADAQPRARLAPPPTGSSHDGNGPPLLLMKKLIRSGHKHTQDFMLILHVMASARKCPFFMGI